MANPTDKARVLIEALPYIQAFRGATVVVKLGGSAMEDEEHVRGVLTDVAFMECVGMRPVIVHGGGKAISRGMESHGIEPEFRHGLRVTSEQAIRIVKQVLRDEVNPRIVAVLRESGANAHGMSGENVLRVVKKTHLDEQTGETLDWGFVGDPHEVDAEPIDAMLRRDEIPVITPLGRGPNGHTHNVNADSAAAAVAKAVRARKLVFLTDVPGLLAAPDRPDSVISTLRVEEVEQLVQEGVITGGMLPKVRGGTEALRAGVRQVHMVDGKMAHSLLLEIFTRKGVGTQITY